MFGNGTTKKTEDNLNAFARLCISVEHIEAALRVVNSRLAKLECQHGSTKIAKEHDIGSEFYTVTCTDACGKVLYAGHDRVKALEAACGLDQEGK